MVGLFHLQGSSWDRVRRKFYVHDKAPEPLTGQVGVREGRTSLITSGERGNAQEEGQRALDSLPPAVVHPQIRPRDVESPLGHPQQAAAAAAAGAPSSSSSSGGGDGVPGRPSYALYTLTGQELHVVHQDQPLNITLPTATGEIVVVSPVIEVGAWGGNSSMTSHQTGDEIPILIGTPPSIFL